MSCPLHFSLKTCACHKLVAKKRNEQTSKLNDKLAINSEWFYCGFKQQIFGRLPFNPWRITTTSATITTWLADQKYLRAEMLIAFKMQLFKACVREMPLKRVH